MMRIKKKIIDIISTKDLILELGYSESIAEEVVSHLESNNLIEKDKQIMERCDKYLIEEVHKTWKTNGFKGCVF